MRAVIQRILEASVTVDRTEISSTGPGLRVRRGVEEGDTREDVAWLSGKVARMRIFSDTEGKMNRSVAETGGGAIVVSQFTLHASTKKGNRPSFLKSAAPAGRHLQPSGGGGLFEAEAAGTVTQPPPAVVGAREKPGSSGPP